MHLSPDQKAVHARALELSTKHRRLEAMLVAVLKEIDKSKLYRKLGQASLFSYAVKLLGLSESTAYAFISVARKSDEVALLFGAIEEQRISVAKASRIVSALTIENAAVLIEFARTHSTRETEFEVAKLRPKAAAPDRARPISEDLIKLEMCVSKAVLAKLQRAQALVASKTGKHTGYEGVLDAVLTEFIERHDPVTKAERAHAKKMAKEVMDELSPEPSVDKIRENTTQLCTRRVLPRKPPNAAQKHEVSARDGGRCTHIDSAGKRCDSDRWLHVHHLIPVSRGGGNEPENLVTLCSFHHDLAHQLSLPIEGQVTWRRERGARYSA